MAFSLLKTGMRGGICGGGVYLATYSYNRLGEKGKLPYNFGWVTPATDAAIITGIVGSIVGVSKKLPPAIKFNTCVITMGLVSLKAIENSRKEIEALGKDFLNEKNSLFEIRDR